MGGPLLLWLLVPLSLPRATCCKAEDGSEAEEDDPTLPAAASFTPLNPPTHLGAQPDRQHHERLTKGQAEGGGAGRQYPQRPVCADATRQRNKKGGGE